MASQFSKNELLGLVKQLETLKHAVPEDEAIRKVLYDAARNLSLAIETPGDSIQRVAYSVCLRRL